MTDPGATVDTSLMRALPSLEGRVPVLFCAAGAAVLSIGALPWLAVLLGAEGIGWALLVLAAVAVVGGVFVLLVGIGLFRARSALRAQAAHAALESALDTELNATLAAAEPVAGQTCDDHVACASCDASCALNALRG